MHEFKEFENPSPPPPPVLLTLLERGMSFCPGTNLTELRPVVHSIEDLDEQLNSECARLGCDGPHDICCPYFEKKKPKYYVPG